MSEFTPRFAPVVVLLFLGTALITGASFVVGHENSPLHKKIYFGVDAAPPLGKAAQ